MLQVLERARAKLQDAAPWDGSTSIGESLLTPTVIYVNDVLKVNSEVQPHSLHNDHENWGFFLSLLPNLVSVQCMCPQVL